MVQTRKQRQQMQQGTPMAPQQTRGPVRKTIPQAQQTRRTVQQTRWPVQRRRTQLPMEIDPTPLKNMLEFRSETYIYPPVVQGPFLLNVSNDLIKLACGAMLAKATDSRAGLDGRWKSAEELERDVLLEFFQIIRSILKRCFDNADELKRMATAEK